MVFFSKLKKVNFTWICSEDFVRKTKCKTTLRRWRGTTIVTYNKEAKTRFSSLLSALLPAVSAYKSCLDSSQPFFRSRRPGLYWSWQPSSKQVTITQPWHGRTSNLAWYTQAYFVAPRFSPMWSANTWAITMSWLDVGHPMPSLRLFTRNTRALAVRLIRTSARDRSSTLSRSTLRGSSGSVIKSLTWYRSRSFSSQRSLCPSTFLVIASL